MIQWLDRAERLAFPVSAFVFCLWFDIRLEAIWARNMSSRLRIESEGAIYHLMARRNAGSESSAMKRTDSG